MAVLILRNLPDQVRDWLRLRAAKAGTSMEEQVRIILTQASKVPAEAVSARALPDWVDALYGGKKPQGVVAELLAERAAAGRAESSQ